jgi:hypothetical protein
LRLGLKGEENVQINTLKPQEYAKLKKELLKTFSEIHEEISRFQ